MLTSLVPNLHDISEKLVSDLATALPINPYIEFLDIFHLRFVYT